MRGRRWRGVRTPLFFFLFPVLKESAKKGSAPHLMGCRESSRPGKGSPRTKKQGVPSARFSKSYSLRVASRFISHLLVVVGDGLEGGPHPHHRHPRCKELVVKADARGKCGALTFTGGGRYRAVRDYRVWGIHDRGYRVTCCDTVICMDVIWVCPVENRFVAGPMCCSGARFVFGNPAENGILLGLGEKMVGE